MNGPEADESLAFVAEILRQHFEAANERVAEWYRCPTCGGFHPFVDCPEKDTEWTPN